MMRRWPIAFLFAFLADALPAQADTNLIVVSEQVQAFSVSPPHAPRGYFAPGAKLQVMGPATGEMVRVRFTASDGRVIEALCRVADLVPGSRTPFPSAIPTPPPPVAPAGRTVPGSVYENPEWLEDGLGHKKAVEAQAKFDVPMLVYFYADWNEECEFLWKELLSTRDFKRETRQYIKVRINPEHGKAEGLLARQYKLRKYPTTFVVGRRHADPRYVDLMYRSFGKLKVSKLDYALADLQGVRLSTNVPPQKGVSPQPPAVTSDTPLPSLP